MKFGEAVKNPDDRQPVVLVAEDRDEDLFMLRRAFQQLGFNMPVQYVRNGEQAIAYIAGEGRFANREEYPLPDLLLLDLKMPRKNGFEVLEWIQAQPTLNHLRTVVLPTSDDLSEVSRAYQLGAASFITSPSILRNSGTVSWPSTPTGWGLTRHPRSKGRRKARCATLIQRPTPNNCVPPGSSP